MSTNSTTLPNIDPAGDIRRQMAELRCELREDFDGVAATAKELVDWKHYVKQAPWLTLGLAAVAGFAVVPRKVSITTVGAKAAVALAKQNRVVVQSKPQAAAESSLGGFLMRMASAAVVRTAVGFASQKIGEFASAASSTPQPKTQPATEGTVQ